MIIEHYPNPNKKVVSFPSLTTHKPVANTNDLASNVTDKTPMLNGHGLKFNTHHAKKMGLPLHIFVGRDAAIRKAAVKAIYLKGDKVYPVNWEDYQQKGACVVMDVIRSYIDWPDDLVWDDKFLYLVEAVQESDKFNIFRATPGFFAMVPPVEPAMTGD